jgi:hypothetical protein
MQAKSLAMPVRNEIYRNLPIPEVHELSGDLSHRYPQIKGRCGCDQTSER